MPSPDPLRVRLSLVAIPLAFFSLVYASSFTPGYGYFIDEFYFLACAARPGFGYVDHPPLAPWVLTAVTSVVGTSVAAIRIIPAAAGAATVFLAGRLARRLPGAGPLAEALAAMAMSSVPVLWSVSSFYSMNAFEPLLALLLVHGLATALEKNSQRQWLLLGLWMGLGVLNKHTFVLITTAVVLGLVLSGQARRLWSRGAAVAALSGSLVALPNLLWQAANGFPSLEFYRTISAHKNIYTPPADFVVAQLVSMNALVVGLSFFGSVAAIRVARLREFRFLAFAFCVGFVFFLSTGSSRVDRLLFVYCWALPLGAWCVAQAPKRRVPLVGAVAMCGVLVMTVAVPVAVPWLSPERTLAYTRGLGINTEVEPGNQPPLPQLLADRIGWGKKVSLVAHHYRRLPASLRAHTAVSAGNYGKAGALELLGEEAAWGQVLSPHNSYYLWSRELLAQTTPTALLHLGPARDETALRKHFESVSALPGELDSPYVTNYERGLRVFLCQWPKRSVAHMLEETRFYY